MGTQIYEIGQIPNFNGLKNVGLQNCQILVTEFQILVWFIIFLIDMI